ncbi:hypothetical protein LTR33_002079 [Friedmanniomyces endolithicus]|nr:hypothetical protein LTR33_002079 [Friedmanniomyces endolithicus]
MTMKPSETSTLVENFDPAIVALDAASTRVVIHPIHPRFKQLAGEFLDDKLPNGSKRNPA